MKTRIIAILLLLTVLNLSLLAAVSAEGNYEQSKGGFNVQSSEILRGKSSNQKPSETIATGIVAPELTGKRYAIIIGINYVGTSSELQYCVQDALDFKTALFNNGWGGRDQVTLLTDLDATHDAIKNAIAGVVSVAGPKDEVVFFYSGHGSISNYDADGDGEKRDECMVPVELTAASHYWDGDLKVDFQNCKAGRLMFFFDSCYAGGMNDLAGPNRLICMACGENQLSLESTAWSNGQFTYYFADQAMTKSRALADTNKDSFVTFEEAFDYARANCRWQTPVASDGFADDMLP